MRKIIFLSLLLTLLLTACADNTGPATTVPTGPVTSNTITSTNATTSVALTTAPATLAPVPTTQTAPTSAAATSLMSAPAQTTTAPPTTEFINMDATQAISTTPLITPAVDPTARAIRPANCCQEFSFAADGRLVYFDKPANDPRAGVWAFDLKTRQPTFLTEGFGSFAPDLSLAGLTNRVAGTTRLLNLTNGQTLATLSNGASLPVFAPDKSRLAYLQRSAQQEGPEAPQRFSLYLAGSDGSQPHAIWSGRETEGLAWFPDNRRLLLSGRDEANQRFGLWEITTDGAAKLLVESKGLSNVALSPDGQWVAYWITFQGAEKSGVWLAHSDGTQARKLSWTGSFRWANRHDLFYLPVGQPGEPFSTFWRYDPTTDQTIRLTDPSKLQLQLVTNQWQISSDGRALVFRNAKDNALWQISF